MTIQIKAINSEKTKSLVRLENVLYCIILGIITLRATYIENPHIQDQQTPFFLTMEIISLLASSLLLGCFVVWFGISVILNQVRWRKTYFAAAVGLFMGAGLLAAGFASNKRAALTDLTTLLSPMVSGLLLVQLLDSREKIRLALFAVIAVGAAATVQCYDQHSASNDTLIAEYEKNPTEYLQKQGIEPDSLEHYMYEHRLYSKDVRGFLMTSNSAASYFLLAVFAGIGLCVEALRKARLWNETLSALICYVPAFIILLAGLVMTQSKGGNGAFILGLGLFVILLMAGKRLWKFRNILGIVCLIGIAAAVCVTIFYGVRHGRLPGGNSMLVRWQYWQSTAAMIRDHILTGIGGGNYSIYYMQYKLPAASETIQNPHNFILSVFSQYGILGLAALLAAIVLPFHYVLKNIFGTQTQLNDSEQLIRKHLWLGVLAATGIGLLFIRPVVVDAQFLYQNIDVRAAAYVVLYLMPAGIFMLVFFLLRAVSVGDDSMHTSNTRLTVALLCGLGAVLIHNLVDFALFEPGIWGVFWLFIAIMIAELQNSPVTEPKLRLFKPLMRFLSLIGLAVICIIYLSVVLLPPIRANRYFKKALASPVQGGELLDKAVAADPLSMDSAYQIAGILTQTYNNQRIGKNPQMLIKAIEFAEIAGQRNPADFKPRRLESDIYVLLAEQADEDQKDQYLQKAYDILKEALIRYPGSGKIYYNMGLLADELRQPQTALEHYKKAVEIEDAYQAQFRIMYPDRKTIVSRMGYAIYHRAQQRIRELEKPESKL